MALSAESGSPASPAGVCHVRWVSKDGAIDEIGSGILIDRRWVLTAVHVVEHRESAELRVHISGVPPLEGGGVDAADSAAAEDPSEYAVEKLLCSDSDDSLDDIAVLKLARPAPDECVLPLLTDTAWYLSRWQVKPRRIDCWAWRDKAKGYDYDDLELKHAPRTTGADASEVESVQLDGGVLEGYSGGAALMRPVGGASLYACLGMIVSGGLTSGRSRRYPGATSCLLGMGRILPWLRQHDIPHRTLSAKDRDVFTAVDWKPQAGEIQLGADADFPGLITWNTALTELLGRETELEALRTWANQAGVEKPLVCRVMYGEGGVGKTRLAAELADELSRQGWQVAMGYLDKIPGDIMDTGDHATEPWLVVLDYPEHADHQSLASALRRWHAPSRPVAVLLLSRHDEHYWERFGNSCLNAAQWHLDSYQLRPLENFASYYLLTEALRVFGIGPERVDQTAYEEWLSETQERDYLRHPLLILGQALCLAADRDLLFAELGHQRVIMALVEREYGRLLSAETSFGALEVDEKGLTLRLHWLAILTGTLSLSTLEALAENPACSYLGLPKGSRLLAELGKHGLDFLRDGETGFVLEPLAPDVLAAGFAWRVWDQWETPMQQQSSAWLLSVLKIMNPDALVDALARFGQLQDDVEWWLKLPTGPVTLAPLDALRSLPSTAWGHQQIIKAWVEREYSQLLCAERAYGSLKLQEQELTLRLQWLAILTGSLSLSTLKALSEDPACSQLGIPKEPRLTALLGSRGLDILRDGETGPVLEPLAPDIVAAGVAWQVWDHWESPTQQQSSVWLAAVLTRCNVVDALERFGQRRHDIERWLKLPTEAVTEALIGALKSDSQLCDAATTYYSRNTILMPDVGAALYAELVAQQRGRLEKKNC